MKFTIPPKALIALIIVVIFFGVMILSVVDPKAIIDFLTPKTNDQRRLYYTALVIAGTIILALTLKHKKPVKTKDIKRK